MKVTRRLASLLLALAVLLCMTIPAFADDTGSITVENPQESITYTAYKIFDVVYNEGKTAYSYIIDRNSEWYNDVNTYFGDAQDHGLHLKKAADIDGDPYAEYYIVTTTDAFSPANFANFLKNHVAGKTGIDLVLDSGTGKASVINQPLGYYFVTTGSGALCNLTTTDPEAVIRDKNDVPFEKNANAESVYVGQTVTYTITGEVPSTKGFEDGYTYTITDTMDPGITFDQDSLEVSINGVEKTGDVTITKDTNTFTVSIPVVDYTAGDEIVITYQAVVNKNAAAVVTKNTATLTYTNGINDSTAQVSATDSIYTSKIVINKFDKETDAPLAGAKFVLCKVVTSGSGTYNSYYQYNEETDTVSWTGYDENNGLVGFNGYLLADINNAKVFETDANGKAEIIGLYSRSTGSDYYLVEIEAPAGYNALDTAVKVQVKGDVSDVSTLTYEVDVPNSTGVELPETGGIGTTIFYIVGATLALGAVVLLITKRRMSVQ